MNHLKLQIAFALCVFIASFLLTCLMFIYMVEYQGHVERTHAIFGILFATCNIISFGLLRQVVEEYHEAKDEQALKGL